VFYILFPFILHSQNSRKTEQENPFQHPLPINVSFEARKNHFMLLSGLHGAESRIIDKQKSRVRRLEKQRHAFVSTSLCEVCWV
jgi:hypothetical protein